MTLGEPANWVGGSPSLRADSEVICAISLLKQIVIVLLREYARLTPNFFSSR